MVLIEQRSSEPLWLPIGGASWVPLEHPRHFSVMRIKLNFKKNEQHHCLLLLPPLP